MKGNTQMTFLSHASAVYREGIQLKQCIYLQHCPSIKHGNRQEHSKDDKPLLSNRGTEAVWMLVRDRSRGGFCPEPVTPTDLSRVHHTVTSFAQALGFALRAPRRQKSWRSSGIPLGFGKYITLALLRSLSSKADNTMF